MTKSGDPGDDGHGNVSVLVFFCGNAIVRAGESESEHVQDFYGARADPFYQKFDHQY